MCKTREVAVEVYYTWWLKCFLCNPKNAGFYFIFFLKLNLPNMLFVKVMHFPFLPGLFVTDLCSAKQCVCVCV